MSIYIMFTDESNPFVRYNMTPAEFAAEVLKWSDNYDLVYTGTTGGDIIQFTATDKLGTVRPGDLPPW